MDTFDSVLFRVTECHFDDLTILSHDPMTVAVTLCLLFR